MKIKTPYFLVTIVLLSTLMTGCGFKLRGSHFLPEQMQTLNFKVSKNSSELVKTVAQHLKNNDVKLLNKFQSNVAQLTIIDDRLDRRTLSLFENGQLAEYELIYTVRYAVNPVVHTTSTKTVENTVESAVKSKAKGTAQPSGPQEFDFEIYRNYQDDPSNILAKSRELDLILNEMRQQAADKILRQLATIK